MTQKHYIEIAAMLNEQRQSESVQGAYGQMDAIRNITLELAKIMKRDNPRFKAGKFFDAAGFPELTNTQMGLS